MGMYWKWFRHASVQVFNVKTVVILDDNLWNICTVLLVMVPSHIMKSIDGGWMRWVLNFSVFDGFWCIVFQGEHEFVPKLRTAAAAPAPLDVENSWVLQMVTNDLAPCPSAVGSRILDLGSGLTMAIFFWLLLNLLAFWQLFWKKRQREKENKNLRFSSSHSQMTYYAEKNDVCVMTYC